MLVGVSVPWRSSAAMPDRIPWSKIEFLVRGMPFLVPPAGTIRRSADGQFTASLRGAVCKADHPGVAVAKVLRKVWPNLSANEFYVDLKGRSARKYGVRTTMKRHLREEEG
ncbi:MAG: hypothetical protein OXF01_17950 [Gemmatimonadetes bacterium]|nr:hypothetical protein [Gemmatimonadota bacterium]